MPARMKPREFLELPPELEDFEVMGPTGSLVKPHYQRLTVQ